jgi:hypothetical protein
VLREVLRSSIELVEIVAPRTNAPTYTPAEHVFAALATQPGAARELAGDAGWWPLQPD